MAISTLVRRTVSSMVLLVLPAIKARGSHLSTLVSPLQIRPAQEICRETFYLSSAFSSIAKKTRYDADLLPFIESEIKCAEESDNHDQKDEVPDRFPFEIQDNPGQQTVTLRREYGSEIIIVEVHMPGLVTGEDGGGNDDDDDSRSSQSSIPLVVSVSKGDGPSLEFGCTAYPDEVAIDSMSVKEQETSEDQIAYEGPDFSDLDENLQKAFHKYLEIRGIKSSTTNFLHEYMINKDSREYLTWLKNVKKFIEK